MVNIKTIIDNLEKKITDLLSLAIYDDGCAARDTGENFDDNLINDVWGLCWDYVPTDTKELANYIKQPTSVSYVETAMIDYRDIDGGYQGVSLAEIAQYAYAMELEDMVKNNIERMAKLLALRYIEVFYGVTEIAIGNLQKLFKDLKEEYNNETRTLSLTKIKNSVAKAIGNVVFGAKE